MQKKQSELLDLQPSETLCNLYQSRSPVKPLFDRVVQKYSLPTNERKPRHATGLRCPSSSAISGQNPGNPFQNADSQSLTPSCTRRWRSGYTSFFSWNVFRNQPPSMRQLNAARQPKSPKGFMDSSTASCDNPFDKKRAFQPRLLLTTTGKPVLNHPEWLIKRWQQQFRFRGNGKNMPGQ